MGNETLPQPTPWTVQPDCTTVTAKPVTGGRGMHEDPKLTFSLQLRCLKRNDISSYLVPVLPRSNAQVRNLLPSSLMRKSKKILRKRGINRSQGVRGIPAFLMGMLVFGAFGAMDF